jgi:predicted GIY-YIG superfamily endonuclease
MSFWAYMLHCRGGYFYVGHTDDLDLRVAQHQTGSIPGFASDHRPVELVWSQEFQTRDDARAAEKQIKGWSRAKKLALIRGDWDKISSLAKGTGSPSTSSGKSGVGEPVVPKTDHPELVEGLSLLCHPDTPSSAVEAVQVSAARNEWQQFVLLFKIVGDIGRLSIPSPDRYAARLDGLWRSTCVEAFVRLPNAACYAELNFAPSTAWAAYQFDSYRQQSVPPAIDPPPIDIDIEERLLSVTVAVDMSAIGILPSHEPWQIALSAIIEETDGTKSYWALRHPPGAPDFHHPDCFALTLEAPNPA